MLSRPEQALHVVGRVSWGILVGMWKAKMLRETVRVYPCVCVRACVYPCECRWPQRPEEVVS